MNRDGRTVYSNRVEAGALLAEQLEEFRAGDAIILAIPRGGVVVGGEIARTLGLPLDVVIPRKIGAPEQPELAIGAVAAVDGISLILDERAIRLLNVPREYIQRAAEREGEEIRRRTAMYREGRSAPEIAERTVILVDDGIATGYTIRAAIQSIRGKDPREIVLAVPVAPPEVVSLLRQKVDRLICPSQPEPFFAVGVWYEDFPQVSDEEVIAILKQHPAGPGI